MSSTTPVTPKLQDLAYDAKTRNYTVALPSCVSRSDAEAFRSLHPLFEIIKNSKAWLQQRGYTAVDGFSPATVIIVVAQETFNKLKTAFNEWLAALLATRKSDKQAASA